MYVSDLKKILNNNPGQIIKQEVYISFAHALRIGHPTQAAEGRRDHQKSEERRKEH